ncbi:MAG: potassium uptake protein, TrkH family [Ruminococcaceae bacterium]|nr:potassium uptake protein, TrkH family [Oscillospiraceae bacterium]
MHPAKLIALVFGAIILLGAGLLTLPAASRSGVSCNFLSALFTATSATCVTGLSLFDTYTQWSGFGQVVILVLIQLGGLGFMSIASLLLFMLGRRVGLKERMVIAQSLSVSDLDAVVRLQKTVLVGSFAIEAVGAVVLMFRFMPAFGFPQALKWGVFHSVSAFCNAGFDIFGVLEPGSSLAVFQSDPVVLMTISALIVIGGLGFLVWQEMIQGRRWKAYGVYTKLVIIATVALLVTGMAAFLALEWNNPQTLGAMSVGDKLLNGFFQSVTTRTAGFASFDQAALSDGGKAVTIVLMLVGGCSGSTAGGVKTVTVMVLLLFLWSRLRGRSTVTVFKRTIPAGQVLDAMTLTGIMVLLAVFGAVFISATSPIGFTDGLYESVSALATVGLTAGATGKLSLASQMLIILYMYFGRVGVLTLSMGFLVGDRAAERIRYAQTNLLIG